MNFLDDKLWTFKPHRLEMEMSLSLFTMKFWFCPRAMRHCWVGSRLYNMATIPPIRLAQPRTLTSWHVYSCCFARDSCHEWQDWETSHFVIVIDWVVVRSLSHELLLDSPLGPRNLHSSRKTQTARRCRSEWLQHSHIQTVTAHTALSLDSCGSVLV
jgi:hypothetical protein